MLLRKAFTNIFNCCYIYFTCIISLNRCGPYIDSPKWLKNKQSARSPKNNDDKCFQYALTIALNHKNMDKNFQVISKIKLSLINMIGKK